MDEITLSKITPPKSNIDNKMMVSKKNLLSNMAILGIHVSFRGCISTKPPNNEIIQIKIPKMRSRVRATRPLDTEWNTNRIE